MFSNTLCSYEQRGKYGNAKYRGNCSGKIIEDIITTPMYKFFDKSGKVISDLSDYMVGSGTTEDVCRAYGIPGIFLDLNRGFDLMTMDIPNHPKNIFWHPPYGNMITYSDNMYSAQSIIEKYGFDPRKNDLSRALDWDDFMEKTNYCESKLFHALEKGGRLFILVGDWKQRGVLYSMLCDLAKLGTLEQIIIKAEHNCFSDNNTYANNNFIKIQHEYLIVLRKDNALIIPVSYITKANYDVRECVYATWKQILRAILEEKGAMYLKDIYSEIANSYPAKVSGNSNYEAKCRQILQDERFFIKIEPGLYKAA